MRVSRGEFRSAWLLVAQSQCCFGLVNPKSVSVLRESVDDSSRRNDQRVGRLALHRERGRVRVYSGQTMARAGSKTPHLNPLPLAKGRGGSMVGTQGSASRNFPGFKMSFGSRICFSL